MKEMKKILLILLLVFIGCYSDNEVEYIEPVSQETTEVDNFEVSLARVSATASATVSATVSPTVVTGGTGDVITINGSGFGEKNRLVWGNIHQLSWQIQSWTDTKIIAVAPSFARTGQIIVRTLTNGDIATNNITVRWSTYNATGYVGDSYGWFRPSQKGLVFHCPSGTSSSFKQNLRDALAEWACETGVEWSLGADVASGTTSGADGVSVAYLGASPGCASASIRWFDCGGNDWYTDDIDMTFDGCTGYNTILHELGHALGIGHNYNGGSIMSPSGGSGLGSADIEAGRNIVNYSLNNPVACQSIMVEDECVAPPVINTYYQDADGDGYGNPAVSVEGESQPTGYVSNNRDCDDTNASINPSATEIYDNGVDEDCDGVANETPIPNYVNETQVKYSKKGKNKGLTITVNGDFDLREVTINGVLYSLNPVRQQTLNISLSTGVHILYFVTVDGVEYTKNYRIKGRRKK